MDNALIIVDPNVNALDQELATRALHVLHKHYPEWCWVVDAMPGQDSLIIRNTDCDPRGRMGFFIRKTALYGDPSLHKVMLAGGEFLERYRQRRAAYEAFQLDATKQIFTRPDT